MTGNGAAELCGCSTGSCMPLATGTARKINIGLRLKLFQAAGIAEVIRLALIIELRSRFGRVDHHAANGIANSIRQRVSASA